jgi:Ca2+-binding EF-hand superfamily protein
MTDSQDAALRQKFNSFDSNGSGAIDADEFQRLVRSLGVALSDEYLHTAFLAIDVNGNGRIDFGEFRTWWARQKR